MNVPTLNLGPAPTILTYVFRGIPQTLQIISLPVSRRYLQCVSKLFTLVLIRNIRCMCVHLFSNAAYSETLTASLNDVRTNVLL